MPLGLASCEKHGSWMVPLAPRPRFPDVSRRILVMELANEFLLQKSRQWGLTGEQEDVLVRKFGQGQSNRDIAEALGISINACVQCLGEIYRKAGITGTSRGKAHRLRADLVQEATQQATPKAPSAYIAPGMLPEMTANLSPLSDIDGKANRQYLEELLDQLQQRAQDLSLNPDGEAADEAIQLLSDSLPRSTTALASESHWKRVEVVRQIIHQVSKLFTTIDPSLEECDGLAFLSPEKSTGNPLHRSITAFIQRTTQQLNSDDHDPPAVELVLQSVAQEGHRFFKDKSVRPSEQNPSLKTYSAWVRRASLGLLVDRFGPRSEADQTFLIHPRHGIDRNLLAVDAACLGMYLSARKDDVLDLNYFDILVARWMKSVPWRKNLGNSPLDEEHPILFSIDPVDLEWASLSALRRRYHKLDVLKKYDLLHGYFLDRLRDVRSRYRNHFWLDYDDIAAFADDKYKIVGIPRSFLGPQETDRDTCEAIAGDVRRYCELAAYSTLNQKDLQELDALLLRAGQSTILDFWFNEIDHFMDHQLNRQKNVATRTGLIRPLT